MNDLQALIELRGLTAKGIALALGANYHSVQKQIKGVRTVKTVRPRIASYLGLDEALAFGPGSRPYLRRLIAAEIERRAAAERERLRARYLRRGPSIADGEGEGNA